MARRLTAAEIGGLMQGLEVTREPVGRLAEYEGNAKQHTAEQVEQIKASMREFGMVDPIGVWTNAEGKSEVVEGHGRLMAARELGLSEVPVIHLDALTDGQRRAYALVHNKLTMNTGWDFGKLDAELDSLSMEFDMGDFGFDAASPFDAIEDLMSNDFATLQSDSSDTFNITFTFPSEHRDRIELYVKENGKESIVRQLTAEALQWA